MAQLHPQECYLLEYLTSLEHFCNIRDAMIEAVKLGEQCLDDYMQQAPADLRRRHTSLQPDIVWGGRVLPNLRNSRDRLIKGCILRSHDDPQAFRGGVGLQGDYINKGIGEFDASWMPKQLGTAFWDALYKAIPLDSTTGATLSGSWQAGDLSWSLDFNKLNGVLEGVLGGADICLPEYIPLYELDPTVVIRPGDKVPECGIYLPNVDNVAAQFLHVGRGTLPGEAEIEVRQGLTKDEYGDWIDEQDVVPDTWTLIRRIPNRFIAVPPEGFYPKDKPSSGRVEAGQPCPQAGLWWTPAKPNARQRFAAGDVMPDYPDSRYGATIWYREAE
ncbi:hypothetical protein [Pseudogulbenkiania ferrooxidans]|uniref:Immunity protein 72 domain-containing protein n=1 Tax=Pseudogulbenkiania ferrooxidans 2002 TaxID=279714 RepID=B9Z102_9NEIS|nr:hypothetical protein [Pseudogulbenkiania ferrooxidans]EEG09097.1 conserved hypothetical protein [Pseudogulbenkiania ferrooxidans 2002]